MAEKPKRWGQGRIVFMADLPAIRDEIARAVPLTEVFASRSDRLGIGYSAFCKLVAKYAPDAKIRPHQTTGSTNDQTQTSTTQEGTKSARRLTDIHTGIADPATLRKLTRG